MKAKAVRVGKLEIYKSQDLKKTALFLIAGKKRIEVTEIQILTFGMQNPQVYGLLQKSWVGEMSEKLPKYEVFSSFFEGDCLVVDA